MDVFRQLTRGVHFNTKRFKEDAVKFGLAKTTDNESSFGSNQDALSLFPLLGEEDASTIASTPPESASNSPMREEEEEESGAEDDTELTLLGNIKVKRQKPKAKKKTKERLRQLRIERVNRFRNAHRIHVHGTDLAEPADSWQRLRDRYGISDTLFNNVMRRYSAGPTPVQMQAVPFLLDRREVLACAPTGSGKTAAYLVPLLHMLATNKRKKKGDSSAEPRAVVLAPTRELAMQIQRECLVLGEGIRVRSAVLEDAAAADGKSKKKQKRLNALLSADIIVSTPNRLCYLLKEKPEYLSSAEHLIVDESDKLFEAGSTGFRDQLAAVYRACPTSVQRGMFSATLAVEVEQWCKLNLDNPVSVTIGIRNMATEQVRQELVYTGTEKGKLLSFKNLVDEGLKPPVLVFVQTKERAKDLFKELQSPIYGGLKVDLIHSERSQLQREAAIKNFRAGRVWILICTELLGRGIDFKGVNLVVNYDFPPSTVSYIHRVGRTGRAGRSGRAVTFFTDADKTLLRSIAQLVKSSGGDVPEYMLQLKKASRQEKRKLAKKAVLREGIREESKYDKERRVRKEEMVAASKRRKRKAEEEMEEASQSDKKKAKTELKKLKKKGKKKISNE